MKKQFPVAVLFLLAGLLIQSCGHTNKLGKYDLSEKKILYEEQFTGNVIVNLDLHPNTIQTGSRTDDVIVGTVKSIGESIVEGDVESKIMNAANPNDVARSISGELKETMVKYLTVTPTDNVNDVYFYIVTTRLKDITLNSNEYDMFLHLKAEVEITEQGTADVVWDYCDSRSVSLRNYLSNVDKSAFDPNISDIMLVTSLLTLSEENLRTVINAAARDIGREFSKQFRKDLSKARGK